MEIKKTLYGSIAELKMLEQLIEQDGQNIDDIYDQQKAVTDFIAAKTDAVAYYNQEIEDQLELIEKHIQAMKKAKEVLENKQIRFHRYILDSLNLLGVQKLSGQLQTISIRSGREKVDVYDINQLPVDCIRTKTTHEADKIELLKRLKAGEEIQGAKIIKGEPGLSFKIGVSK